MADVSKLIIEESEYNIKDANARSRCSALESRADTIEYNLSGNIQATNALGTALQTTSSNLSELSNRVVSDEVDIANAASAASDAQSTANSALTAAQNAMGSRRFSKVRIYFEDTQGKANAANKIKQMLGLSGGDCVLVPCRNCAIGTTASDTTYADVILSEGGVAVPDIYIDHPEVSDIIILCGYPDIDDATHIAAGANALMTARDHCYSNALITCVGVDWAASSTNRGRFDLVYNHFKNNLNGDRCYYFNEYYVLCNKTYLEANDAIKDSAGEFVGRYVANRLLGGNGYGLVDGTFRNNVDSSDHAYVEAFDRDSFLLVHDPRTYTFPDGTIIAPNSSITFDTLDNNLLTAALGVTNLANTAVCITPTGGSAIVAYGTVAINKVGTDVVLQIRLPSELGFTNTYIGGGTIFIPAFRALIPMYRL